MLYAIGFDVRHSWDKKMWSNLELSVIDREICSTADQFVGNAFSGYFRITPLGHRFRHYYQQDPFLISLFVVGWLI
jgi:hypothetical protein